MQMFKRKNDGLEAEDVLAELGYRQVPRLEAKWRDELQQDIVLLERNNHSAVLIPETFWYRPSSDCPPGKVIPLWCPWCGKRHVDQGEFADRPHHTHRCVDDPYGAGCEREWRLSRYVFGAR